MSGLPNNNRNLNRNFNHIMPEDVRTRLFNDHNEETIRQVDSFVFHYLYERGFTEVAERYGFYLIGCF
jgi:hypothetical protein